MNTYVCVDLETTGLNPKTDKIIEIGAIRIENGKKTGEYHTLVNPGRALNEHVKELTGLSDDDLSAAPYIEDVLEEFLIFEKELPLLGHSVLFDYSFLKKACVDRKLSFERSGVDTLRIARRFLSTEKAPELPSRALKDLCIYFSIPHKAHRALGDVYATDALFSILREKFEKEEPSLFQPTALQYKAKRDSAITQSQKERLLKLLKQNHITPEYDVNRLTKSEASRYTDLLLAEFGR